MKKKVWIATGIIGLIIVFISANIWKSSAANEETVEVTQLEEETISETIMVPGQLKLADEQSVYYSPEKGEVEEILVEEGEKVKKGTPLIRYKNTQLELEQEQTALQLRSAQLQVDDLKKQHREIDEQLEDDEDNEQLKAEHDQIKLQEQQAKLELEQLHLQKKSLDEQAEDLVVQAEFSGTVVEVNEENIHKTDQLEPKPVIRLGTIDQMIVEGVISEYDTLKIKEGQQATLSSDAVPDQSWEGEVRFIAELPKEDETLSAEAGTTSVQYPLEVIVEGESIGLKPGFQMVVEITTDEQEANTLPTSAVQQDGETNYVFVVHDGRAERREVEVGTITNDRIEITDGITAEEQVIAAPDDSIQDGMDVNIP